MTPRGRNDFSTKEVPIVQDSCYENSKIQPINMLKTINRLTIDI